MKIAIVMPRGSRFCPDNPNSIETVVRTLLGSSQYRRSTTIICDEGAAHAGPATVITVPEGLRRSPRNLAVEAILRAIRPDQIEYHQHLKSAADIAKRFRDTPQVFYRHTRVKAPRHLIEGLRYRRRLRQFEQLVFVSQAARSEFLIDYPTFAAKAAAVCNPVDASSWSADPTAKEKLIVFAGRPTAEKGFDLFCTALIDVLEQAPDWQASLMLGEWEKHAEWAAPWLTGLARFGDRVQVVRSARLAQVQVVTRRAAIAVTPSRVAEALGLSALEAHAAGAAVVSSGRGGLKEASGPYAVYVEPIEARGLAQAIDSLIRDDDRRIAIARAGQAYVIAMHSPACRASQLDLLRAQLVAPAPAMFGVPAFAQNHAVGLDALRTSLPL